MRANWCAMVGLEKSARSLLMSAAPRMERCIEPVWNTRWFWRAAFTMARASYGERQRLFAIDILARFAGFDCYECVPMIGHRDDHGVNVFARQQVVKLFVFGAALELLVLFDAVKLFDNLAVVLAARRIDVTNRQNLGVRLTKEIVQ